MPTEQPSWKWSDQPSVVVEHPDWRAGLTYASALREAGFAVLVCSGPDARGMTGTCPLLAGKECALVAGADVVVSALGTHTASGGDVIEALLRRRRACVVVATDAPCSAAGNEVQNACTCVDERGGSRAVVAAVRAELRAQQAA